MNPEPSTSERMVRAASMAELAQRESMAVNVGGRVVALFRTPRGVFAVDNRCPHMGFPLERGTVKDCILTCHWHHARFDLTSGGTFDPWADDVRTFPVKIVDGEIWIDAADREEPQTRHLNRLRAGLEREIPLVIAKAVIALMDGVGSDPREAFRLGLDFGTRNRRAGWGSGLTILTCMMNLLPALSVADRARAMYQGLAAVAADSAGHPPRFVLDPLPGHGAGIGALKRWLRQFVEVRDAEGAERCIVSAVRSGVSPGEVADMLFAAATDHRYLDGGHVLDFTNKALEALDHAGWDCAEPVLASLASHYANAPRMEEDNAWRHPIDLIPVLDWAFASIPPGVAGRRASRQWNGSAALVEILLGDDPNAIAQAMVAALREGCAPADLAATVAHAAALRIVRFPVSNEFGDWDRAHHTFTFANAVHQGLSRVASAELIRGVFDAAMSVYLDRFLNVPAAKLPESRGVSSKPAEILNELPALLDRQQRVNEAGALVAGYLAGGADTAHVVAALGHAMLREDRDFHSIQNLEAAIRQYSMRERTEAGTHMLIATARYIAAHAPTVRAQEQTYRIATRLHRGDRVFEDD
jgi:nitrite reductase/ring-hydroxylating ferredoxin subunit